MPEPAVPDLHALAHEALFSTAPGTLRADGGSIRFRPTSPGEFIDAVLAAVLPAHRAMVLEEAAQAIEDITGSLVCDWTKGEALASIRDLAEPGPETVPTSTRAAQNGPAVPASTPTPDGGAKAPARWRVGRKVGRTVYRQSGPDPADSDVLVGVMDTPELAAFAVEAMNRAGGDSDAT